MNVSREVRRSCGRGGRTVDYVCTTNERLCPTKAARAAPTADLNVGAFRIPGRTRSFPSTQVLRNRPRRIRVRWFPTRDAPRTRASDESDFTRRNPPRLVGLCPFGARTARRPQRDDPALLDNRDASQLELELEANRYLKLEQSQAVVPTIIAAHSSRIGRRQRCE